MDSRHSLKFFWKISKIWENSMSKKNRYILRLEHLRCQFWMKMKKQKICLCTDFPSTCRVCEIDFLMNFKRFVYYHCSLNFFKKNFSTGKSVRGDRSLRKYEKKISFERSPKKFDFFPFFFFWNSFRNCFSFWFLVM